MPPSKPKASELAAEAKRVWFPYILRTFIKDPQTSYAYLDSCLTTVDPSKRSAERTCVAVMEGDPVTLALGWYQDAIRNPRFRHCQPIPVVNMANENRAGGDWESGTLAPEECFARRSNLVQALTMPWRVHTGREESYYPIPQRGGIYSPLVYVFRGGPDTGYAAYPLEHVGQQALPVISVAPVRKPRLDVTETIYSFQDEKELMKDKLRTILRIAAHRGHRNLVVGAFGLGPTCRNPTREVAKMWRKLLFEEEEFCGVFTDVVFAMDTSLVEASEVDVFREELNPSKIFPTRYS